MLLVLPLSTPTVIRRKPVSSAGAFNPSARDTIIILNEANATRPPDLTRGAARTGEGLPDDSAAATPARGTTEAAPADRLTPDTEAAAADSLTPDREARIINYQSDSYQDGYHFQ